MDTGTRSEQGRVKKSNQDRFAVQEMPDGWTLLAVADGMGGEAGGEIAAETAVDAVRCFTLPKASPKLISEALADMARRTGDRIHETGNAQPELQYMGTTLTAVLIREELCCWVHVGDSRLYVLRDGEMRQITRDHRFVQDFLDSGELTEEQAAHHPMANVLDQCLGTPEAEPDSGTLELQSGDVVLLCSDGLTDELDVSEIAEILTTGENMQSASDRLAERAIESGGRDNVTVAAARIS